MNTCEINKCGKPCTTTIFLFIIEDNTDTRTCVCQEHLAFLLDNSIPIHMHSVVFDPATQRK